MLGLNSGTLGVVTLTELETGLKCVLLIVSIAYTAIKIAKALKHK